MITLTVCNIKGGVAKTTTASVLAAGLCKKGKRVLMIDSDPQTNLTMCFTNEPGEEDPTLYTIYSDDAAIKDVKIELQPGLDLVAGDFSLCSADMQFAGKVGSFKKLSKALRAEADNYDYVIIDTPPNLGFLSLNAFMASDYIITPMAVDSFSLKAIRLLKETIEDIVEDRAGALNVLGVVLTRYTDRTNIAKALEDNVNMAANLLNTTLFETRIRQATSIMESQLLKMSILDYAPKSPVAQEYQAFVDEVLARIEG